MNFYNWYNEGRKFWNYLEKAINKFIVGVKIDGYNNDTFPRL